MEMSQRIHIWYQILLKIMIFWENGNKKKEEKLVKKKNWESLQNTILS